MAENRLQFIALTVKKTSRCNFRSYHKLWPIAVVLRIFDCSKRPETNIKEDCEIRRF